MLEVHPTIFKTFSRISSHSSIMPRVITITVSFKQNIASAENTTLASKCSSSSRSLLLTLSVGQNQRLTILGKFFP